MKKLLIAALLLSASPVFAYSTFEYETPCALQSGGQEVIDVCKVVETREKGGALRTRNIFSNAWGLTIKSRFDKVKGFVTWDSYNKFEYKWDYKIKGVEDNGNWSEVMPGVLLQNVSWD